MRVVAVCDRVLPPEGGVKDGVKLLHDYRTLLEEDLDVLIVCLTNALAPEVTIAGLERGLHVFCEKPPGRDLDDISRVIAAERANPALKLMYGFNHRYHESVQDALKLFQSGALGRSINS